MTNQPPATQPPIRDRQAMPTLLEDVRLLHAATSELAAQWGHTTNHGGNPASQQPHRATDAA